MRTFHRIGGLLCVLLMLYLASTGTMMQLLDLKALLSHAPETDPTVRSFEEGMYGNDDFPVIQLSDFSAAALPEGFDIISGIGTVLRAMHKEGPGYEPSWVELRVSKGIPVGQLMVAGNLQAFNAISGVRAIPIPSEGLSTPPSLRDQLKRWHRFWDMDDVPGVYFELLSGICLWVMLITGLVMYFRLLDARTHQGRSQLIWIRGGGLWRGLHRIVSLAAALFILGIAFSGTWLGFESVVHSLRFSQSDLAARRVVRADLAVLLHDSEVQEMAAVTLAAMQRLHPNTQIKVLRVRVYGRMKQGVVVTGGERPTQLVFNAETGMPATLSDATYLDSGFPFGAQVHEKIKQFHSGALFGLTARSLNLLAGFSLIFLSISGIIVYFDMWLKRRRAGRHALLWR